MVSNKISFGKKYYKYFIGYLDENRIKPLTIVLLKTNAYVKSYEDESKWIYFSIEEEELSKKYNDIWNNISNRIKEELDTNPSTTKDI